MSAPGAGATDPAARTGESSEPAARTGESSDPAARTGESSEPCAVTIVAHDIGPVGGMERVISDLIRGLLAMGHEVTVIARTCELEPHPLLRFRRVRGPGRPFLLAYPWFMLAGSLALGAHARRRRRAGSRAREIVQATGGIVLRRTDTVAVHYCHQVGPATPSRSSAPFRANIRVVRLAKRLGERMCFFINRGATFVCVSEGVAEEVREHYPRLRGRVLTIHNGIDIEQFRPGARARQAQAERGRLGIGADRPVAVFAGGEWDRKGLRPAIEALADAPDWTLLVVGAGDRPGYEALAASLGVGERVRWLGVSRDMPLAYAMADAFVLPSSYETFSLVTFEAAASGLPVLATPVNGVRELIDDGRNGFLISREPQSIAVALRTLSDPALRARLGQAAREAAEGFSRERMVARHHELYERLAGASKKPLARGMPAM